MAFWKYCEVTVGPAGQTWPFVEQKKAGSARAHCRGH